MKAIALRLWRGFLAWPLERRIVVAAALVAAVFCAEFLLDTSDSWRVRVSERMAAGKNPTVKHNFQTGIWYGTLASVVALVAAAATAKWWLQRLPRGWGVGAAPPRLDARFWLLVGLAVVFALGLRWPRMDESVYVDEEHTLRDYNHGAFEENADGQPQFEPARIGPPLWDNRSGNNHLFYSIISRASLDIWRWLGDRPRVAMDETAFRMPSLLGGLAGIVLLALLAARLGFPDAGWLAAWLLALQPWHLRYSAEGRGYALMIMCLLGALYCLIFALQSGRWRWWIGFGLLQFLMMGFYAGSLYVAAAINLAALGYLGAQALRTRLEPPWRIQITRWLVAGVLTATLTLQAKLPWILELLRYLENPRVFGSMRADWYLEVWSYLLTGMQWASDDPGNLIIITARQQFGAFALPLLLLLSAVTLAGILRLLLAGGIQRVVAAVFLLAGPLALAHSVAGGRYLFTWYMIFLAPGVVLGMALAVDWAAGAILRAGRLRRLVIGGLAVCVYALIVCDQAATLSLNPKEDFREIVRLMRGEVDPEGRSQPAELTAFSFSEGGFYDPWARTIWDAEDVRELMRQADAERRPLHISYGHRALSLARRAEIMELLDDPRLFREIAVVPGLEERQFTHYVLRYIPGSFSEAPR